MISKHHIGFIVENLEKSKKNYLAKGFEVVSEFEKEGCRAYVLDKGTEKIEIFEFYDQNSPLLPIVKYHVGYQTDDIDAEIRAYQKQGYTIVRPMTRGITVKKFAFIKNQLGDYIELIEP